MKFIRFHRKWVKEMNFLQVKVRINIASSEIWKQWNFKENKRTVVLIYSIFVINETCQTMNKSYQCSYLQWNPHFSNPRVPEPLDISNQTLFPLDLLLSLKLYNFTLDFSNQFAFPLYVREIGIPLYLDFLSWIFILKKYENPELVFRKYYED